MIDISKCEGKLCYKRKKCWRYIAPSDEFQTWFMPEKTGDACEYFWDNENRIKRNKEALESKDGKRLSMIDRFIKGYEK